MCSDGTHEVSAIYCPGYEEEEPAVPTHAGTDTPGWVDPATGEEYADPCGESPVPAGRVRLMRWLYKLLSLTGDAKALGRGPGAYARRKVRGAGAPGVRAGAATGAEAVGV